MSLKFHLRLNFQLIYVRKAKHRYRILTDSQYSIFESQQVNHLDRIDGLFQIKINGEWFNLLYINHYELSLICHRFGFTSGTIVDYRIGFEIMEAFQEKDNFRSYDTIKCLKNFTDLNLCKIEGQM